MFNNHKIYNLELDVLKNELIFNKKINKLESEIKRLNEICKKVVENKDSQIKQDTIDKFKKNYPMGKIFMERQLHQGDNYTYCYQYVLDNDMYVLQLFKKVLYSAYYSVKEKDNIVILFITSINNPYDLLTQFIIDKNKNLFIELPSSLIDKDAIEGLTFTKI